jgi:hypothetical protein
MDITVYLPDDTGKWAKENDLPLSRLLRGAVEAEREQRKAGAAMPEASNSWRDPTAAWWAKADRAQQHIQDIGAMMAAFGQATAFEIRREPTDEPGKVAFRLHVNDPVPVQLLTTIGDALHNMRSSLDSVAYELARRHLGDVMTDNQQGATQFPICLDRAQFDSFLSRRDQRDLYGEHERNALRCVQPFALREEAAAHGVTFATTPEEEYRIDVLARLSHVNNLDKHRRLPFLAWYVDFVYLTGEAPGFGWSLTRSKPAGLQHNDVIGYLTFPEGDSDPSPNLKIEMRLALADDLGYAGDFVGVLERWHSYLANWVLPRIFAVADGKPPPMFIGSPMP